MQQNLRPVLAYFTSTYGVYMSCDELRNAAVLYK